MEEYTYIRTVGEGAYGDVWLTQRRGGTYCAVKVFKQAHEDAEIRALAKREARILQTIDHVNCVKMLDAFKSKSGRVYLVFDYIDKGIFGELDANPYGLPPRTTKLVTWQLLNAVAYLHGRKIVHRDIKPANILMTNDMVVKLCDFGFARTTHCGPHDVQGMSTYCVTRWYRPPEVLVSDLYGPSADVWSIGCTIAEVATGRPLFPGKSTADQLWRIMRCLGPLAPQHLTRMLADERARGVGVPQLHRNLRQRLPEVEPRLFQLLEACLQANPVCRPTAEELLQMPYFWDVPHLVAGSSLERLYSEHTGRSRKGPEALPLQKDVQQQQQWQRQQQPFEVMQQGQQSRQRSGLPMHAETAGEQGHSQVTQGSRRDGLEATMGVEEQQAADASITAEAAAGATAVCVDAPEVALSQDDAAATAAERVGLSVLRVGPPPPCQQQMQPSQQPAMRQRVQRQRPEPPGDQACVACCVEAGAAAGGGAGREGPVSGSSGNGDLEVDGEVGASASSSVAACRRGSDCGTFFSAAAGGGEELPRPPALPDPEQSLRVESTSLTPVAMAVPAGQAPVAGTCPRHSHSLDQLQLETTLESRTWAQAAALMDSAPAGTMLEAAAAALRVPHPSLTYPAAPSDEDVSPVAAAADPQQRPLPLPPLARVPPSLPLAASERISGEVPLVPAVPGALPATLTAPRGQQQDPQRHAQAQVENPLVAALQSQAQLIAQEARHHLRPVPSVSCSDALVVSASASTPTSGACVASMNVIGGTAPAPNSASQLPVDAATATGDTEIDEQYDGLSELRCTAGRMQIVHVCAGDGVGSVGLPVQLPHHHHLHHHLQEQQQYRPLFTATLEGDAAQAWKDVATCPALAEDGASLSANNNIAINSVASAAITLSSALPAAAGCEARTSRTSRQSASMHLFAGGATSDGYGNRHGFSADLYASDTQLMRLPGEAAAAGLRTSVQRRAAAEAAAAAAALQQQSQTSVWVAARPRQPSSRLLGSTGRTAGGGLGQVPGAGGPRMRGSDNGSMAPLTAALADGRGGSRAFRRPLAASVTHRAAVGGRVARHAAGGPRASFNGSGCFAFPALAVGGRLSCSGTPAAPLSGDRLPSGSSNLDSIPLGDLMTPVGAPEMPSYTGCLPPHRRPAAAQTPWAPPSRGNSDSLALLKMPFPHRPAAVPPLSISPCVGAASECAQQQQQDPAEADGSFRTETDAGGGSGAGGGSSRVLGGAWGVMTGLFSRSSGSATVPMGYNGSNRSLVRPQPVARSRLGGSGVWDAAGAGGGAGGSACLLQAPVSGSSTCAQGVTQTATTPPSGSALVIRSQESLSTLLEAGVMLSPLDGGGERPVGSQSASAFGRREPWRPSSRVKDNVQMVHAPLAAAGTAAATGSDGKLGADVAACIASGANAGRMNVTAGSESWGAVGMAYGKPNATLAAALFEEGSPVAKAAGPKEGGSKEKRAKKTKARRALRSMWKSFKKVLGLSARLPEHPAARSS